MTSNTTKSVVVVDNSPSLVTLFRRGAEDMTIDLVAFSSTDEAWVYLESNKPENKEAPPHAASSNID